MTLGRKERDSRCKSIVLMERRSEGILNRRTDIDSGRKLYGTVV
jgi:hypothetical protein